MIHLQKSFRPIYKFHCKTVVSSRVWNFCIIMMSGIFICTVKVGIFVQQLFPCIAPRALNVRKYNVSEKKNHYKGRRQKQTTKDDKRR